MTPYAYNCLQNAAAAGVFVSLTSVTGATSLTLAHYIGKSDSSINPKYGCLVLFFANLGSILLFSNFIKHGANDNQSTKNIRTFTAVAGSGLLVGALTALICPTIIKSSREQIGTGILLLASEIGPIAMSAIGLMS